MSLEYPDLEPTLKEVRAILNLFVTAGGSEPWRAAVEQQVESVVGVRGPYWNTKLLIEGNPPAVPRGTRIPLDRELDTRPGVEPSGTFLLWLDDLTGVISSVEFATYAVGALDRYPVPGDLTVWH